jgi:hypothetical protein
MEYLAPVRVMSVVGKENCDVASMYSTLMETLIQEGFARLRKEYLLMTDTEITILEVRVGDRFEKYTTNFTKK